MRGEAKMMKIILALLMLSATSPTAFAALDCTKPDNVNNNPDCLFKGATMKDLRDFQRRMRAIGQDPIVPSERSTQEPSNEDNWRHRPPKRR